MTHSQKLEIVDIVYNPDSYLKELSVEVSYFLAQPVIDYPTVYIATLCLKLPLLSPLAAEEIVVAAEESHMPALMVILNNDSNFKECVDQYQQEVMEC